MREVAIIGAGPSGAAAAIELLQRNIQVTLLDEQHRPGGQIYRNVTQTAPAVAKVLGKDYISGKPLMSNLLEMAKSLEHLTYHTDAVVWSVDRTREICWRSGGKSYSKIFDAVILATGALERPMPMPGWTLPGVMTAGAAQIIMKSGGQALGNSVLLGSGPLLYLVAHQMAQLGRAPKAILDTSTFLDEFKAAKHLRPDATTCKYLVKGMGLLVELKKAGVKRIRGVENAEIKESERGLDVFFSVDGKRQRLSCEHLLLHAGVVPNTQITRALDAEHDWDESNLCFNPRTTYSGALQDIDGFWVSGDGVNIMGAEAAAIRGRSAALDICQYLGVDIASKRNDSSDLKLARYVPIRKFLNQAYLPKQWFLTPPLNTIVCRCEEVTAAEIKTAFDQGAQGPNQAKAFTRCGMGACQGRYCGLTVSNIFAQARNISPSSVGYYRIRTPIKPVRLGELASHEHHHKTQTL